MNEQDKFKWLWLYIEISLLVDSLVTDGSD